MATVLNLAVVAYFAWLGATLAFNPTGPSKWPIALKLPLPKSLRAGFMSPQWLLVTRIMGAIIFVFALWSLVLIVRHQFKP